jgi:hypothetical protein
MTETINTHRIFVHRGHFEQQQKNLSIKNNYEAFRKFTSIGWNSEYANKRSWIFIEETRSCASDFLLTTP